MKSTDGTREVAATAPTTDFEEPLSKVSGRSRDGGGYGAQVARQIEQQGIGWGQEHHRVDPLQPSGDSSQSQPSWWEQSIHTSG